MAETRNLLYEAKKQADSRSSPFYNPADRNEQLRQELRQLRNKNRIQQTQIIRLKDQISELRDKIFFYQDQIKTSTNEEQESIGNFKRQISRIPIILENKQLKDQMSHIHEMSKDINAKNRQLEALNRQLQSQIKRSKTKLKQLEILQSIRSEQFKSELQNAKPVIIQDNKQFGRLSEALKKIVQLTRSKIINVSYEVFLRSARQCENDRKTNSYNIFLNYWGELQKSHHLGYLALLECFKSFSELEQYLKYEKQQIFDINDGRYRDTMNEWIINSLIQIKHLKNNTNKLKEQKLFRLLGLLYRSNFPIKGQKYDLDDDLKKYFEELLCQQITVLLQP